MLTNTNIIKVITKPGKTLERKVVTGIRGTALLLPLTHEELYTIDPNLVPCVGVSYVLRVEFTKSQ